MPASPSSRVLSPMGPWRSARSSIFKTTMWSCMFPGEPHALSHDRRQTCHQRSKPREPWGRIIQRRQKLRSACDRERCEKTHVAHAARVCKRGMCALCTGAVVSVSEGAYGDSYLDDILIGTEDFPDFYCYC